MNCFALLSLPQMFQHECAGKQQAHRVCNVQSFNDPTSVTRALNNKNTTSFQVFRDLFIYSN